MVELAPDLIEAYKNTYYKVKLPDGELSLYIDQRSTKLLDFLSLNNISQAAIITAYNPQSLLTDNAINQHQQAKLYNELVLGNYMIFNGVNSDPHTVWQDESSFLVCHIDLQAAQKIAKAYQQNALVFIKKEAIPRLIFC